MIRKLVTSLIGLTLLMFLGIVALIVIFDQSIYTDEEIEWCATERPLLPMYICAKEFGY